MTTGSFKVIGRGVAMTATHLLAVDTGLGLSYFLTILVPVVRGGGGRRWKREERKSVKT